MPEILPILIMTSVYTLDFIGVQSNIKIPQCDPGSSTHRSARDQLEFHRGTLSKPVLYA